MRGRNVIGLGQQYNLSKWLDDGSPCNEVFHFFLHVHGNTIRGLQRTELKTPLSILRAKLGDLKWWRYLRTLQAALVAGFASGLHPARWFDRQLDLLVESSLRIRDRANSVLPIPVKRYSSYDSHLQRTIACRGR